MHSIRRILQAVALAVLGALAAAGTYAEHTRVPGQP